MTAEQYILDLEYLKWHLISDIPEEITSDVIELIDENFHCKILLNDGSTAFRKYKFE